MTSEPDARPEAWPITEFEEYPIHGGAITVWMVEVPEAEDVIVFQCKEEAEAFARTPQELWLLERLVGLIETVLLEAEHDIWGAVDRLGTSVAVLYGERSR